MCHRGAFSVTKPFHKVLIIGGSGYLGRHLYEAYSGSGYLVSIGSRRTCIPSDPNIQVVKLDAYVDSIMALTEKVSGFDLVVNCAGLDAAASEKDPKAAIRYNAIANYNLALASLQASVKKFIFISTAHIYGHPLSGLALETDPLKSNTIYGMSKFCGEEFLRSVSVRSEFKSISVRLANCFGPPINPFVNCWHLLVNDVCLQATRKNYVKINSDGSELRDFISIYNARNAIVHLSELTPTKSHNAIFNLGFGHSISVLEMVKIISRRYELKYGHAPRIDFGKKQSESDLMPFQLSVDLLSQSGFKPENDLEEVIDQCLDFCFYNLNQVRA